MPSITSME